MYPAKGMIRANLLRSCGGWNALPLFLSFQNLEGSRLLFMAKCPLENNILGMLNNCPHPWAELPCKSFLISNGIALHTTCCGIANPGKPCSLLGSDKLHAPSPVPSKYSFSIDTLWEKDLSPKWLYWDLRYPPTYFSHHVLTSDHLWMA